jgi:hypothetical protein
MSEGNQVFIWGDSWRCVASLGGGDTGLVTTSTKG